LKISSCFGRTCRLHRQGRKISQEKYQREASSNLRPWRWRRHVPPKRRLIFNGLQGVIPRKIEFLITRTARTWSPTWKQSAMNMHTQNASRHSLRIIDWKALHCGRGVTSSEKTCYVSEKGIARGIVCSYRHLNCASEYFPCVEGRDEWKLLALSDPLSELVSHL
jgi:hypothetical protein